MGVQGLNTWLRQKAPPAYRAVSPSSWRTFDHVYIDVNALIYSAFRACGKRRSPELVAERLFAELDAAIRMAVPRQTLTLAADGPAPLAKLVTQRKRRVDKSTTARSKMETARAAAETIAAEGDIPVRVVLSARERAECMRARAEKEEREAARRLRTKGGGARATAAAAGGAAGGDAPDAASAPPAADPLSQLQITPGALFMLRLDEMLEYYACQRVEQNVKVSIEVNGARVPGEGEVKMMSRMRENAAAARRHRRRESHAVVGSDSDLKLLSIAAGVDCFVVSSEVRLPDKSGYVDGMLTFSTRVFRETFLRQQLPGLSGSALRGAQRDFLLLCFMTGNDYMPCMLLRLGVVTRASSAAELAAAEALDSDAAALAALPPPADGRRPGGAAEDEEEGAAGGGLGGAGIRGTRVLAAHARAMAVEAMADGGGMGALNRMLQSYGAPVVTKADCTYVLQDDGRWACSMRLNAVPGLTTETIETRSDPKSSKGAARGDAAVDLYLRLQSAEALAGAQSEADDAAAGGADAQFVAGQVAARLVEAYTHGLAWTLGMYLDGECGDYRWAYEESRAPTAEELLRHIHLMPPRAFTVDEASAAARAAGRDPSALLPHQAAMAMLPRAGRPYVPTPLRPLMDSAGAAGAVYDRDVCVECDCLRAQVTAVTQALGRLRKDQQDGVAVSAEEAAVIRGFAQRVHNRLMRHRQEEHPDDKAFPIADLLAAIDAVPAEAYPDEERAVLRHAHPTLFVGLKKDGGDAPAADASPSTPSTSTQELASAWARGLGAGTSFEAFDPPSPPGRRLKPLRSPMHHALATAAGGSLATVRRGVSRVLRSYRGRGGGASRALATIVGQAPRMMV
eukprot:PRCOL_00004052-RA